MPVHIRPFLTLPLASWLLGTLLVLSSGPVYAEWVSVSGSDEAGMTVYVDPATIRRKGNLVKMWALYDFKTIQNLASGSMLSFKKQHEYDCEEERARSMAMTNYTGNMGAGNVVFTNSDAMKWEPITPGAVEQDLWKLACGKQ